MPLLPLWRFFSVRQESSLDSLGQFSFCLQNAVAVVL